MHRKNVTRTECSFSRSAFLHLSSVLRIATATQQNHNANADYCERPRSKAWETCTSCKYSSPLAPFFPSKLLVRTEELFRKAVSRHTPSYWDAHNAVIVRAARCGTDGAVCCCVWRTVCAELFVCATARAERWYITIIIAVITVPDEHTAWRALKERWRELGRRIQHQIHVNSTVATSFLLLLAIYQLEMGHRHWPVFTFISYIHCCSHTHLHRHIRNFFECLTTRIAFIKWFAKPN